jgi:hypothetical protein
MICETCGILFIMLLGVCSTKGWGAKYYSRRVIPWAGSLECVDRDLRSGGSGFQSRVGNRPPKDDVMICVIVWWYRNLADVSDRIHLHSHCLLWALQPQDWTWQLPLSEFVLNSDRTPAVLTWGLSSFSQSFQASSCVVLPYEFLPIYYSLEFCRSKRTW